MAERVLIVGAGPVGLMTGLRLARAGIPCLLVEAEPELPDELRASTFHPPTLDMLDEYGITDALIAQGLKSPTWQIRLHATGERAEFDLAVLRDDTAHPYRLQCEQSRLGRLLLDMLRREAAAEIWFGSAAVAARQSADGVTLTVRREGVDIELEGRFLVGADGARSIVRKAMGLELGGKTYPETTLLVTTTFAFQDHLPHLSNVNYVWMEGGTFSLLRLPDRWRCSVYPEPGETPEEALAPVSLERKLQRVVPRSEPYAVMEKRPYRVHQRVVERYHAGRMLLAGDAAHLNSPAGGMGMNGGLHDAFSLTDKLIRVWRGEADASLFALYTAQRRPVAVEQILAQADRNRARMRETDPERRRAMLADLQAIATDPARARAYLLKSSMIDGLRQAAAVAA